MANPINYSPVLVNFIGGAYKKVVSYSNYNDPLSSAGADVVRNSRKWGDASPATQEEAINAIISAAQAQNLTLDDTALLLSIAQVESGFNPSAAAGTTSASGLGQFVNATDAAYGLNASNRWNLEAQAQALVNGFIAVATQADDQGLTNNYIYALWHDGPSLAYRGLQISNSKVMPQVSNFESWLANSGIWTDPDPIAASGPTTSGEGTAPATPWYSQTDNGGINLSINTASGDISSSLGLNPDGSISVNFGGLNSGNSNFNFTFAPGSAVSQSGNIYSGVQTVSNLTSTFTVGANASVTEALSTSGWNVSASTQSGATSLTIGGDTWTPSVSTLSSFANGTLGSFFTGQATSADATTTSQLGATIFDPSSATYLADETAVAAAGALPTAGQDDNYSSAATSPTDNSSLTLVDYSSSTGDTTTSSWADSAYTTDDDDDLDDTDDDDPFQYAGSDDSGDDYGPLAVDLTGTGVQFIAQQNSQAYFDIAGTGVKTRVGWIGPNAGFLVLDGSGVGPVTGTQMVRQSFSLNGQAAPARQASCFNANLFDPNIFDVCHRGDILQ